MTLRKRHIWMGIGIVVLLPILVPLITLHGAQGRILRALNAGLGRNIRADAVHLRLFPLPGVELDGVRLAEDPAFGLEDMVVADDATAAVRVGSLLTGRLVFARIHLDRPSINLVRNRAGEWNIAALLNRTGAAGTGAGKTGKGGSALAPSVRFPYVEWSDARVNFKFEQTKTRFYLDQVQGSLARESAGWRLQARFQPQRTDLNVSDTGDVTVDGLWPAAGQAGGPAAGVGFHQRPFDLVLRLQNSYLAGSSALLVGHDAGVHGILAVQVHVQGTGQQFRLEGTLQAQALRRWDLLPPPATVNASFAGAYFPSQDRFELAGIGDPGFRHLRLQGTVNDVFTHPSADLTLSLHQFAAANLIPLALAVKARLPERLQAEGVADGAARVQWSGAPAGAEGSLRGSGQFTLTQFRLFTDREQLRLPLADLVWSGGGLRLPASVGSVGANSASASTPVRLSAQADRRGFQFQLTGAAFTATAVESLTRLLGLRSPWPPALEGTAKVRLGLSSAWSGYRDTGWSGQATLATARFRPQGSNFILHNVTVQFADPQPVRVNFTTALAASADDVVAPVAGTLQWSPTSSAPLQFDLHAAHLRDAAVWRLLHPPPGDLVQRVFGDVTPVWVGRLHARGTIAVDDLDWQGVHTGLRMQLEAEPNRWRSPSLELALAGGTFVGSGAFDHGSYHITGAVAPEHSLRVGSLLDGTVYRGVLSGQAAGTVQLTRPVGDFGLEQLDASGTFDLRRGSLATAAGAMPFRRFAATYQLHNGVADLSQVLWIAGSERWEGKGAATFDAQGLAGFDLRLEDHGRKLHLMAAPRDVGAARGGKP